MKDKDPNSLVCKISLQHLGKGSFLSSFRRQGISKVQFTATSCTILSRVYENFLSLPCSKMVK